MILLKKTKALNNILDPNQDHYLNQHQDLATLTEIDEITSKYEQIRQQALCTAKLGGQPRGWSPSALSRSINAK